MHTAERPLWQRVAVVLLLTLVTFALLGASTCSKEEEETAQRAAEDFLADEDADVAPAEPPPVIPTDPQGNPVMTLGDVAGGVTQVGEGLTLFGGFELAFEAAEDEGFEVPFPLGWNIQDVDTDGVGSPIVVDMLDAESTDTQVTRVVIENGVVTSTEQLPIADAFYDQNAIAGYPPDGLNSPEWMGVFTHQGCPTAEQVLISGAPTPDGAPYVMLMANDPACFPSGFPPEYYDPWGDSMPDVPMP